MPGRGLILFPIPSFLGILTLDFTFVSPRAIPPRISDSTA